MNAFQRGIVRGTRYGGFVVLASAPISLLVDSDGEAALFLLTFGVIYVLFAELLRYVGSRPFNGR